MAYIRGGLFVVMVPCVICIFFFFVVCFQKIVMHQHCQNKFLLCVKKIVLGNKDFSDSDSEVCGLSPQAGARSWCHCSNPTAPCEMWHNCGLSLKACLFLSAVRVSVCVRAKGGGAASLLFLSGRLQQLSTGMSPVSVTVVIQGGGCPTASSAFTSASLSSQRLWPRPGPAAPPWRTSTSTTPTRRRSWRTATPKRSIWSTGTPSRSMRTWWRFVQHGDNK